MGWAASCAGWLRADEAALGKPGREVAPAGLQRARPLGDLAMPKRERATLAFVLPFQTIGRNITTGIAKRLCLISLLYYFPNIFDILYLPYRNIRKSVVFKTIQY